MKTRLASFVFLTVLTALVLSGCGCFQQQVKGETAPPPAPEVVAPAPEPQENVVVQPEPVVTPPPPAVMLKDINFDFDKYNIRPPDAEILKRNMDWFKTTPGKKVRIEGNCDERGTVEYNLALGQRRADSTKSFLMKLGVDEKLLTTVSFGKEKPLCVEHNEECWAKNRNAHFSPVE